MTDATPQQHSAQTSVQSYFWMSPPASTGRRRLLGWDTSVQRGGPGQSGSGRRETPGYPRKPRFLGVDVALVGAGWDRAPRGARAPWPQIRAATGAVQRKSRADE